jgi:acyl carrier protein
LHESAQAPDRRALLGFLAEMWQDGVPVDWDGLCLSPDGTRVVLPSYPFERTRHWIDAPGSCNAELAGESGTRSAERAEEVSWSNGTELECVVAKVWEEALEVPGIRLDDRFLDIGGDSLVGIRVAEHIESIFGVELSLDELIRSDTTVRTMARLISETLLSATAPAAAQS